MAQSRNKRLLNNIIMKIGKLFLCVIASAAVLAGCKEKEEDLGVPKISVSESSIEFDETGGGRICQDYIP